MIDVICDCFFFFDFKYSVEFDNVSPLIHFGDNK